MDALTAHEVFARVPLAERPDLLDGEFYFDLPGGKADAWPAACVGLISISGGLGSCDGEGMLREALQYGVTILELGHVDTGAWRDESLRVVEAVYLDGERRERAARVAAGRVGLRAAVFGELTAWVALRI